MRPLWPRCRAIRQELDSYREGELPTSQAEAVQTHLLFCAACSRELQKMERLARATAGLGCEPTPLPRLGWNDLSLRLSAGTHAAPRRTAIVVLAGAGAAVALVLAALHAVPNRSLRGGDPLRPSALVADGSRASTRFAPTAALPTRSPVHRGDVRRHPGLTATRSRANTRFAPTGEWRRVLRTRRPRGAERWGSPRHRVLVVATGAGHAASARSSAEAAARWVSARPRRGGTASAPRVAVASAGAGGPTQGIERWVVTYCPLPAASPAGHDAGGEYALPEATPAPAPSKLTF